MTELLEKLEEVNSEYNEEIQEVKQQYNEEIRELRNKKKDKEEKKGEELSTLKEQREKQLKELAEEKLAEQQFLELIEKAEEQYKNKIQLSEKVKDQIESICKKILDEASGDRVTVSKEITIKDNWIHRYNARKSSKRRPEQILDSYVNQFKQATEKHNLPDEKAKIEELSKLTYKQCRSTTVEATLGLKQEEGKIVISGYQRYDSEETHMKLYGATSYRHTGVNKIYSHNYYEPEKLKIIAENRGKFEVILKEFIEKQKESNQQIESILDRCNNIVQVRTAKGL